MLYETILMVKKIATEGGGFEEGGDVGSDAGASTGARIPCHGQDMEAKRQQLLEQQRLVEQ